MKSPGLFDGVVFALLTSLGAGLAGLLLGGFLAPATLTGVILHAAALGYVTYLLRRSRARTGRLVTVAAWALLGTAAWFLPLSLFEQILLLAGFVWLVRSLYFHASLFAAALDFGLVSVGLAVAAWAALNTSSLAAALWSFFLVQALFCWIPDLSGANAKPDRLARDDGAEFAAAYRAAQEAVRKLTSN